MPSISRSPGRALALILGLAMLCPAAANAQRKVDPEGAKQYFLQGQKSFATGENETDPNKVNGWYELAISDFRNAFELYQSALFTYNIGLCYHRRAMFQHKLASAREGAKRREHETARDALCAEALMHFELAIANLAPGDSTVVEAKKKLAEVQELCPSVKPTPAKPTTPEVVPPKPATAPAVEVPADKPADKPPVEATKPIHKKGWFWGVLAAGVVVVGGVVAISVATTTPKNASAPAGDLPAMRVPF